MEFVSRISLEDFVVGNSALDAPPVPNRTDNNKDETYSKYSLRDEKSIVIKILVSLKYAKLSGR